MKVTVREVMSTKDLALVTFKSGKEFICVLLTMSRAWSKTSRAQVSISLVFYLL